MTEASEVVGDITLDGTLAFFIFVGLGGGALCGVLYVVMHRGLPRNLVGGLLFGLLMLVTFDAKLDPLRPENRDFSIIGPGWLAVASFTLLAIGTGTFVAATAGRISNVLPLPGWRSFLYVSPLALVALPTLIIVWPPSGIR